MSAQDRTLDRYQELMQINAAGHVLRAARELGIFAELANGQRTLEQLTQNLSLEPQTTGLLVDCLVSMNVIERYEDDHALSPVMRLLCEHDADLGDAMWQRLVAKARAQGPPSDDQSYLNSVAATQWIHTPAAMQVAEILGMGEANEDGSEPAPQRLVDLGCGSAVWSCAMAYRDPGLSIVAVDHADALVAAEHTAKSIELGDRFTTISGNAATVHIEAGSFDYALVAQRLHSVTTSAASQLLDQALGALKPGGRLILIDLFRGPAKPRLAETVEALRLQLSTEQGRMRTIEEAQTTLKDRGLTGIQFTFIAASRVNLGLIVAQKPNSAAT